MAEERLASVYMGVSDAYEAAGLVWLDSWPLWLRGLSLSGQPAALPKVLRLVCVCVCVCVCVRPYSCVHVCARGYAECCGLLRRGVWLQWTRAALLSLLNPLRISLCRARPLKICMDHNDGIY